jgi:DNA polymerase-3 subunit beta
VKIRCMAKALSAMLSIVARAVSRRSTVPILGAVLFEVQEDGKVRISATDAEMAVSLTASAPVEEAGNAAVPARVLAEVVKSLPDGEVALEAHGGEASLAHGQNTYKLRCYDARDFPQLPRFPEGDGASFAVPAAALSEAVSKVLPSVSKDESRPVLTGVLLAFSPDGKATMVSTDSFRMHIIETELGGPGEEKRAIVPARALREVAKLSRMAEEVRVALAESSAMFYARGLLISTRLIDGAFPEYERLLPDSFEREFAVDGAELGSSLKRVSLFARGQNPPAPLTLAFSHEPGSLSGGQLELSVESAETGGAREIIGAEVPEGARFSAAFNPEYLAQGVATVAAKKVLFRFTDPLKPAMLVAGGEEAAGFRCLIMPMRGQEARR